MELMKLGYGVPLKSDKIDNSGVLEKITNETKKTEESFTKLEDRLLKLQESQTSTIEAMSAMAEVLNSIEERFSAIFAKASAMKDTPREEENMEVAQSEEISLATFDASFEELPKKSFLNKIKGRG